MVTFNASLDQVSFVDIGLLSDNTTEEMETFSIIASSSDPSASFRVNVTIVSIIDNDSKMLHRTCSVYELPLK